MDQKKQASFLWLTLPLLLILIVKIARHSRSRDSDAKTYNIPFRDNLGSERQLRFGWFQFNSQNNANASINITPPKKKERLCNGHANLCNKPANEIIYATMHNANNAILDGAAFLPNHVLDLEAALDKGFRGINLDFGKCMDEVTLVHSSCLFKTKVPIRKVLEQILEFLDENPEEVLILPTEIVTAAGEPTIEEVNAEFREVDGWIDKLYDHPGPGNPWPTLQELIDTDKRIIYMFYNGESCTPGVDCPTGFNPYFQYTADTRFSFPFVWDFNDKEGACEITKGVFWCKCFCDACSRFGTLSKIEPSGLFERTFESLSRYK